MMDKGMTKAVPKGAIGDFDFLVGRWRVSHRRLVGRLVGSTNWQEFDGECSMQKVLGGQANVDDNILNVPSGTYHAMTLRVFDPAQRTWSIFWLDSRFPTTLGTPVVGGFEGNRGVFYSDDMLDGHPVRTRFLWFVDNSKLCRWEQALSADEGKTWETNWYMRFERNG
jgi:hypothetical protein